MSLLTSFANVTADGIDVFYREAGNPNAPLIVLLHGFPTSSHQYRILLPLLAVTYHVLAPDLPGFGLTNVPGSRKYEYTFDNLANTISAFLDALKVKKYAVYIFDYGAPVALRIALKHPEQITAIISQNGNLYEEGLGTDAWVDFRNYWKDGSREHRKALIPYLTYEATKEGYTLDTKDPSRIPPETYILDYLGLSRPGNQDIQLDLFYDYRNNVAMYPQFHQYLKTYQPPTLAIWGKNDVIFVPAGANAFKKDLKNVNVTFLDAGHFAVETKFEEIASGTLSFLKRNNI